MEAEAVDGRLKEAEAKEKLTAVGITDLNKQQGPTGHQIFEKLLDLGLNSTT